QSPLSYAIGHRAHVKDQKDANNGKHFAKWRRPPERDYHAPTTPEVSRYERATALRFRFAAAATAASEPGVGRLAFERRCRCAIPSRPARRLTIASRLHVTGLYIFHEVIKGGH